MVTINSKYTEKHCYVRCPQMELLIKNALNLFWLDFKFHLFKYLHTWETFNNKWLAINHNKIAFASREYCHLPMNVKKKSDECDEKKTVHGSLNQQINECSMIINQHMSLVENHLSFSIFFSLFVFFNSAEKRTYFMWKMFWIYIRSDFHMNDFHFSMWKNRTVWFVGVCARKWVVHYIHISKIVNRQFILPMNESSSHANDDGNHRFFIYLFFPFANVFRHMWYTTMMSFRIRTPKKIDVNRNDIIFE